MGVTWAIARHALAIAVGAAGGYSLVKRLLIPKIRWLASKCPAWAQPAFRMILWLFDAPDAVAKAEAAGAAAVKAKPSTGISGIVGDPRDVP